MRFLFALMLALPPALLGLAWLSALPHCLRRVQTEKASLHLLPVTLELAVAAVSLSLILEPVLLLRMPTTPVVPGEALGLLMQIMLLRQLYPLREAQLPSGVKVDRLYRAIWTALMAQILGAVAMGGLVILVLTTFHGASM